MTDFRARVGRIRMKNGGADVRVFPTPEYAGSNALALMNAARDHATPDDGSSVTGYALVVFYDDNARGVSYHRPPNVNAELLPAYIAEVIRRVSITQAEACNVVNRANGYEPEAS